MNINQKYLLKWFIKIIHTLQFYFKSLLSNKLMKSNYQYI